MVLLSHTQIQPIKVIECDTNYHITISEIYAFLHNSARESKSQINLTRRAVALLICYNYNLITHSKWAVLVENVNLRDAFALWPIADWLFHHLF